MRKYNTLAFGIMTVAAVALTIAGKYESGIILSAIAYNLTAINVQKGGN